MQFTYYLRVGDVFVETNSILHNINYRLFK